MVMRFFYPRSIFDPVMRGQKSGFGGIDKFSSLHEHISKKNFKSHDIKTFCSPFNPEQNKASLQLSEGIFVPHN